MMLDRVVCQTRTLIHLERAMISQRNGALARTAIFPLRRCALSRWRVVSTRIRANSPLFDHDGARQRMSMRTKSLEPVSAKREYFGLRQENFAASHAHNSNRATWRLEPEPRIPPFCGLSLERRQTVSSGGTDWLGRLDSNQGLPESKSGALPLGYAPIRVGKSPHPRARLDARAHRRD